LFNPQNYAFNEHALPVILVAFFMLSLGTFVYLRKKTSSINKAFLWICLSVFLWLVATALGYLSADPEVASSWFKIDNLGVVFIGINVYFFTVSFLGLNRKAVVLSGYAAALVLGLMIISSDFLVVGVRRYFWGYFPIWGPRGSIVLAFFFSLMLSSLIELYRGFKTTESALRRRQIAYFLIALSGAFTGSVDYMPALGVEIYPFGYLSIAFFASIVTYAIVRHQLMDIQVIIKKTIVFAGLFGAAYAIFASFAYLGSVLFENITPNRWVAMAPSVIIIVLMLRPLENFLRNTTERYLFQKSYDYKRLLRTFSDEVLTVLDINQLVNLTVNKLIDVIKLDNAAILLKSKSGERYDVAASFGVGGQRAEIRDTDPMVVFLRETGKYKLYSGPEKKNMSSGIVSAIDGLKPALAIPLMHQADLIGILTLGAKKSDEEFTPDDIDILLPLARTLSIAIANARLFEQLSESQAQAAQREKMAVIGTLSAGINHEICNPLGIARGQCEMFLLNLKEGIYAGKTQEELLEKAKEIMQKVINETDRATVITRKLSSFAKPAKGRPEGGVYIGEELGEVLSLVEHEFKLDNIEVKHEIPYDIPAVRADRKQVQEILFNIIRNAAQSIEGSGTISVSARLSGKHVLVDISDTGAGINETDLVQIFNPFFTTKEPGKGTGLGLFIVKQIIERNGGRITVKSEPGAGTIFTLAFAVSEKNGGKTENAGAFSERAD